MKCPILILGLVLSKIWENYEEAKKCYENEIKINPNVADAHNNPWNN